MSKTLRFPKSADKLKNHFKFYKRLQLSALRGKYEKALRVEEWYIETPLRGGVRTNTTQVNRDPVYK